MLEKRAFKASRISLGAVLDGVAAMALIAASAAIIVAVGRPNRSTTGPVVESSPALPFEPLSLEEVSAKGNPQAKVGILEFSEFECPFCGEFARETLPLLIEKYISPGDVRFAFRHLPLERIHPRALRAAEAVECAGTQSRFWSMHDRLFANPTALADEALILHAEAIELSIPVFKDCLRGAGVSTVRRDIDVARKLGVTGTPTFFIGTITADNRLQVSARVSGAKSFSTFTALLDPLIDHVR